MLIIQMQYLIWLFSMKTGKILKNYQEAAHLYSISSGFHDLETTVKLFAFSLKGIEIKINLSNAVSYLQITSNFNYISSFVIYELFC
jgi:hypothetical protein